MHASFPIHIHITIAAQMTDITAAIVSSLLLSMSIIIMRNSTYLCMIYEDKSTCIHVNMHMCKYIHA